MAALNLGHAVDTSEEGDDILIPTQVRSKRLDKSAVKTVAAGSQHTALIVVGEESNGQ